MPWSLECCTAVEYNGCYHPTAYRLSCRPTRSSTLPESDIWPNHFAALRQRVEFTYLREEVPRLNIGRVMEVSGVKASLVDAEDGKAVAITEIDGLIVQKQRKSMFWLSPLRDCVARSQFQTAEQEYVFEDTKEDLDESIKFLADLKVNCENTKKELAYGNMMRHMIIGE